MLREVATAVADGDVVDWNWVEGRLAADSAKRVASSLRALEGFNQAGPESSTLHHPVRARRPIWLRALLLLAGGQAFLGLLGYLFASPQGAATPSVPLALTLTVFGAAGLALLWGGRGDSRTGWLAGVFFVIAAATSQRFLVWLSMSLPENVPAGWLLALLPEAYIPLMLWLFTREFPQVVRFRRLAQAISPAIRLSAVVGTGLFLVNATAWVGALPASLQAFGRDDPAGLHWALIFGLTVPALVVLVWRVRDAEPSDRRRAAFFLGGIALGAGPLFLEVLLESLFPPFKAFMSAPEMRRAGAAVLFALLLSVPVSTSYAVLAHRLLSVRLVIRRSLQFALARGTLILLAALPVALLAKHLYASRHLSIDSSLLSGPGRLLLLLTVGAALLLALRGSILSGVERRLTGARADHSAVLARFAGTVGSLRSPEEVASLAAEALRAAFGSESALLLAGPGGHLASPVPGPRPLTHDSMLLLAAREDGAPFSTGADESDSLLPWLPESDQQWLVDANVTLVCSLRSERAGHMGLLALGPKRSEAEYSRDDRALVAAVASSTTLALESLGASREWRSGSSAEAAPAAECRACGRVVPGSDLRCSCDGTLVPAPIPLEVNGKFRVERVLGRGGMGVAYLATDLALGRQVALKTLPRLSAEASMRLRREARSMAEFVHPHLALIFGAESFRGVPILVVEYLAGGTLQHRLDRPLGVRETLELGLRLASALEAMHARGLLHRDVKPSNVGFTGDGTPKLLDFGLAHFSRDAPWPSAGAPDSSVPEAGGRITRSHHIVGTPLYLPPEALRGDPPSTALDLWGLHVVLWECLAGRHPFRPAGGASWTAAAPPGSLPDLQAVRPDCPQDVARYLSRALSPRQGTRPGSAPEVARQLAALTGS